MVSTDVGKLGVLCALLLGASALSGCLFVDAHFTLQPDGATDAVMEIGVLKQMMEGEGAQAEMNLDENLVKENWTEPVELDRDEWHVTRATGHAAAGQRLFVEGTPDVPQFGTERHLLTTMYGFSMTFQPESGPAQPVGEGDQEGQGAQAEQPAPGAGEGQGGEAQPEQDMGQALEQLAAMMAASGQQGLRFAVTLPGEIVDSNGISASPDTVAWKLGLTGEGAPEGGMMTARSRLINWPVMGAMCQALTAAGRDDLALPLIDAARRGVVPDPATDSTSIEGVNVPMYAQMLDAMVALDQMVGSAYADQVLAGLGFGADSPDPQMVARVAAKIAQGDFAAGAREGLVSGLVKALLAQ